MGIEKAIKKKARDPRRGESTVRFLSLFISLFLSRARARLLTFRVFAFFMFSRAAACDSLPLSSPLTFSLTLSFFSAIRFHRYRISYSDRDINAHNEFRIIFRINRLFFDTDTRYYWDLFGSAKMAPAYFSLIVDTFCKMYRAFVQIHSCHFCESRCDRASKNIKRAFVEKKNAVNKYHPSREDASPRKLNQFSLRLQSCLIRL